MNVGCDCIISDKFFKSKEFTGYLDICGNKIYVSNKVKITGCSSSEAIVGKIDNSFYIFFGSDIGSIQWNLDEDTIKNHKLKVIS